MKERRIPTTEEKEKLLSAIKIIGGQTKTAKNLNIGQSSVKSWINNGLLPAERVLQLERLTDFKVKRHELRPDIYPCAEYPIVSLFLQLSNGRQKKALKVLKELLKEQQKSK